MGLFQKIVLATALMGGLGVLFGVILALVERKFRVESDPRVDEVEQLLPGLNCGACGKPGCRGAAEAMVSGAAEVNICSVGGQSVADKVGVLLGRSAKAGPAQKAVIRCIPQLKNPPLFTGVETCLGYQTLIGGALGCPFGCVGLGDCLNACPVGAISQNENGAMTVDEVLCRGCGLCVKACPRSVITLRHEDEHLQLVCCNPEKGKSVLAVCTSGCIACGLCVKACPHEAIKLENNLPVINHELCQDCGACVEKCPKKCLQLKGIIPHEQVENAS